MSAWDAFHLSSNDSTACHDAIPFFGTTTAVTSALGIFLLLTLPVSTLGLPGIPVARSYALEVSNTFSWLFSELGHRTYREVVTSSTSVSLISFV